ncbi:hypothetical protein ACFQL1_02590 [Halomicroarcula sp. GCM10025709]|uniref:hypothetical protein n=1 Tax=Halomicroarcula sp. GCM10025709 TaxID=3252669 RepID=UPI003622BFA0
MTEEDETQGAGGGGFTINWDEVDEETREELESMAVPEPRRPMSTSPTRSTNRTSRGGSIGWRRPTATFRSPRRRSNSLPRSTLRSTRRRTGPVTTATASSSSPATASRCRT